MIKHIVSGRLAGARLEQLTDDIKAPQSAQTMWLKQLVP
jgi:hypothetical protein